MFASTAHHRDVLFVLQEQFHSAQADYKATDGMPLPLAELILAGDHPAYTPSVNLLEGSLRYYPLRLESVRLGDKLRAHFECYTLGMDYPVSVRMERGLLQKEAKMLECFPLEPVASWNLIQVRAGLAFRELVPSGRHGLHYSLIDAFHETPKALEQAFSKWLPELLDRKLEV